MGIFLNGLDYESISFKDKRRLFLRSLIKICEYDVERVELKNEVAKWSASVFQGHKDYWCNWRPEFAVNQILDEHNETKDEYFDGTNFNPLWNNRDILLSEGIIEIESKDFETNIRGTYDTCINLIKENIHFAVFYSEGMRSPHIHIYGLFPEVSDWALKELSMNLFVNRIVSIEYRPFIDRNLCGQHKIALEFAKHYRTGHIKKLIFEHIPKITFETTKTGILTESKKELNSSLTCLLRGVAK